MMSVEKMSLPGLIQRHYSRSELHGFEVICPAESSFPSFIHEHLMKYADIKFESELTRGD